MSEEAEETIRREMLAGFFKAMLVASESTIDGQRIALINSTIAKDAILHLLAAIIESRPEIKTRKDIRDATQQLEKELRRGVESLRKEYERTGKRAMPTILAN